MTKYEVLLSQTAMQQLNSLQNKTQSRVREGLLELKNGPYKARPKADIKKIVGPKRVYYRLRVGRYRAIYVVEGERVKVAKILPRDKAYTWLD